ncbi:uncharacterized protein LOC119591217 [Penaeus monodon]|uniref:uncharacterized protein LOC119591217 n=1 Tax=Penaeus monodon TaxID=6687 RepID=UPI0018A79D5F|nr:uncharacterized protein LOC119591217 [Penaeus monodon]
MALGYFGMVSGGTGVAGTVLDGTGVNGTILSGTGVNGSVSGGTGVAGVIGRGTGVSGVVNGGVGVRGFVVPDTYLTRLLRETPAAGTVGDETPYIGGESQVVSGRTAGTGGESTGIGGESPFIGVQTPFTVGEISLGDITSDIGGKSPFVSDLRNESPLLGMQSPFVRDEAPISESDSPTPGDEALIPEDESSLVGGESPIAGDESQIIGEKALHVRDEFPIPIDVDPPTGEAPIPMEVDPPTDEAPIPMDIARRDKAPSSVDEAPISGDGSLFVRDKIPIAGDESPISRDKSAPAQDEAPVSGDESSFVGGESVIPEDELPVPGDESPFVGDESPTPGGEPPTSRDESPLVGGEESFVEAGAAGEAPNSGGSASLDGRSAADEAPAIPSEVPAVPLPVFGEAPAVGGDSVVADDADGGEGKSPFDPHNSLLHFLSAHRGNICDTFDETSQTDLKSVQRDRWRSGRRRWQKKGTKAKRGWEEQYGSRAENICIVTAAHEVVKPLACPRWRRREGEHGVLSSRPRGQGASGWGEGVLCAAKGRGNTSPKVTTCTLCGPERAGDRHAHSTVASDTPSRVRITCGGFPPAAAAAAVVYFTATGAALVQEKQWKRDTHRAPAAEAAAWRARTPKGQQRAVVVAVSHDQIRLSTKDGSRPPTRRSGARGTT